MDFELNAPCKTCPFLQGSALRLHRSRASQIVKALVEEGRTFSCHSTNDFRDDGGVVEHNHCAGAMLFLEKLGRPNQLMRIGERLGVYSPQHLKGGERVFASMEELLAYHTDSR